MLFDVLAQFYSRFSAGQKSFFGQWEEDKHPRDEDGKFAPKNEGETSTKADKSQDKTTEEEAEESTEKPAESSGKPDLSEDLHARARDVLKRIPLVSVLGMSKQLGVDTEQAGELLKAAVAHRDGKPEEKPKEKPEETPVADSSQDDDASEATADDSDADDSTDDSSSAEDSSSEEVPADETPRERAEREYKRQLDADYAYARASAVPNFGEDLTGSARHKANAWQGLDEAEREGKAAELVTRDQLLRNEPHTLSGAVEKNPMTALVLHHALKSLPTAPGAGIKRYRPTAEQAVKDRKDFVAVYRSMRDKAQELAEKHSNPAEAIDGLKSHASTLINKLRDGKMDPENPGKPDRYNTAANSLVSTYKALRRASYGDGKIGKSLEEFMQATRKKYGAELDDDSRASIRGHVLDVMEGKSVNKSFDFETSGVPRKKRFDAAEAYVKHATRKGGREISAATVQAGKKFFADNLKMRGVQFGNYVSDSEREHHLQKSAESFADLMDVVGLPDEAASMGGILGLAIGARGHAGASAHYEPGNKVINLTRASGVGTVAHEWGHFFDHHIGGGYLSRSPSGAMEGNYLSENVSPTRFKTNEHGRVELNDKNQPTTIDHSQDELWSAMNNVRRAWHGSGFKKRLAETCKMMVEQDQMSKEKSKNYWQSHREIFARTFERFVQRKLETSGRENTYLAGLGETGGVWPTDTEVDHMTPAFNELFAAFRRKHYADDKPKES